MNIQKYTTTISIIKNDLILQNGNNAIKTLRKIVNDGYKKQSLRQYNGRKDTEMVKKDGVYWQYAGQQYADFKFKINNRKEVIVLLKYYKTSQWIIIGKVPQKDEKFILMALKNCQSYTGSAKIIGGAKKVVKNHKLTLYRCKEYGIEIKIEFSFDIDALSAYGFILPRPIPNINPLTVEDYVVFDLEFISGRDLFTEIIEIGAIKYLGGKEVERFQTYVKPRQRIPFLIKRITNIDNELVQNAPSIESALPEFLRFIGGLPLVGHDIANNDCRIIREEMYRQNIGFLSNPVIDTLKLAKKIYQISHHRLEDIKEYLNLELCSHEAIDDCLASNRIFEDYKKANLE